MEFLVICSAVVTGSLHSLRVSFWGTYLRVQAEKVQQERTITISRESSEKSGERYLHTGSSNCILFMSTKVAEVVYGTFSPKLTSSVKEK